MNIWRYGVLKQFALQAGQKNSQVHRARRAASGGILRQYVETSQASVTKQMGFFQQPVREEL